MQSLPSFFRFPGQLEGHGQGGDARATALGLSGAVAHGTEGRFERVGGANVPPVFGGESVEGKLHLLVFGQALTGGRILGLIAVDELVVGFEGGVLSGGQV